MKRQSICELARSGGKVIRAIGGRNNWREGEKLTRFRLDAWDFTPADDQDSLGGVFLSHNHVANPATAATVRHATAALIDAS